MARRRQEKITVELVPDEDDGAVPPGAPDDEPRGPGRLTTLARGTLARWRRPARRTRVLVASGAAVAVVAGVGGVAVADAVGDHRRATAMRTVPGGVTDLSVPPAQTWQADMSGHAAIPVDGGAVVVRDGEDVLALDVATGAERWRHRLPGVTECGPWTGAPARPVAEVVCLAGTDGELGATVITAGGEVRGSRDLGDVAVWNRFAGEPTSGPQVTPTSGGLLAVLTEGATHESLYDGVKPALAELRRLREAGRAPSVRLEDALTGEVVAQGSLDADTPEDLVGCTDDLPGDDGPVGSFSLAPFAGVARGAAWLMLCDVGVGVTADGDVVEFEADAAWSIGRADAGMMVPSPSGTTLRTDAGDLELPGTLVPGWVDDRADDVLLVSVEGRDGLRGIERDGSERWSSDASPWVVARTGGTGIGLADGGVDVVGLDLVDGTQRWRRAEILPGPREEAGLAGMATDGVRLLLAVGRRDGFDLLAVDAGTGGTVWEESYDTGPLVNLTTVDGHLVVTTTSAADDGEAVIRGLAP